MTLNGYKHTTAKHRGEERIRRKHLITRTKAVYKLNIILTGAADLAVNEHTVQLSFLFDDTSKIHSGQTQRASPRVFIKQTKIFA